MRDRKKDHIDLTEQSKVTHTFKDHRFDYEPMLGTHPPPNEPEQFYFLGKTFAAPMWISSMTGGTGLAQQINKNLAIACKEFSLGMGLGSCRKLLDSNDHLEDFNMRKYMDDRPLFANLGIAQIIELLEAGQIAKVTEMVNRLEADGLIVHVNPIQEWIQPEGDRLRNLTPLQAIESLVDQLEHKIIVKEVGQGMGPESISALIKLPIAALEFGAFGGTNFAKMEALRDEKTDSIDPIHLVGHTAEEMIEIINSLMGNNDTLCKEFIISGGVRHYLDGYYYNETLNGRSVYGQAAAYLKYARQDYGQLANHITKEIEGYKFAKRFLRIKKAR